MSHVPEQGGRRRPRQIVSAVLATLAMVVVGLAPAYGAVSTTAPVVVNEVYGGGGNTGAPLTHDFVELYNPGAAPVDLAGWSVQYASSAGTTWSGVIPLTGSIAAGGTYLVQGASQLGAGTVSNLPPADASGTVEFADLSDDEIDAYVATGEPLRVAGAFTVDGLGGPFVERIDGDYHTVVGLSLPLLRRLLAGLGVPITDLWTP